MPAPRPREVAALDNVEGSRRSDEVLSRICHLADPRGVFEKTKKAPFGNNELHACARRDRDDSHDRKQQAKYVRIPEPTLAEQFGMLVA